MSTVTSPRPYAPAPQSRPRPPAPARLGTNIDPFRVLRRHLVLIMGSAVLGMAVGVGAFVGFSMFYPLYSGKVLFEIKPGVQDARDVGTTDIFQDQLVLRIGMTETVILTSRGVLDTALRTRYREGRRAGDVVMMTPDKPEKLDIDLWHSAITFEKGHRIAVHVTSSNFPRFEVNPNTGEAPGESTLSPRIATNAIYHDAAHPSAIVLPIVSN